MSNATSKFMSALVAIALVAGAWFLVRETMAPGAQPQSATVLPSPMELPDFTMLDQDARSFTRASLEGSWNLLFFGFTNCPDVCPAKTVEDWIRNTTRRLRTRSPSVVSNLRLFSREHRWNPYSLLECATNE